MQILFVQRVDSPGQIRPVQAPAQPLSKLILVNLNLGGFVDALSFSGLPLAPLLDQLELPTEEVIQQPHIRLYQNREPPRTNNQVRVHERDPKVFHNIGDLLGIREVKAITRKGLERTVTVALLDTPTRQCTST